MVASIEKSSTLRFRKQKNKIVIRHSDKEDMNPSIPDEGEVVFATDTNELYIGDGLSKVEDLSPISGGGGSGTSDYNDLVNKPKINDVTLSGNKTSANLGLASASQGAKADTALQPGANISELTNDEGYITGIDSSDVSEALGYTPVNPASLATVATSGSYNDLSNKPTIPTVPTNVSAFTNDVGYITGIDSSDVSEALGYIPYSSANPNGYITKDVNNLTNYTTTNDLATVALTGDYDDLQNKPYIPEGVIVDQTYDATSTNAQSGTAVAEAVANKVSANTAITGATKCKITYDSKGLVTAGADLTASDIPSLDISKINGVTATASEINVLDGITASTTELNYTDGVTSNIQSQLDSKVNKSNAAERIYATDISADTEMLSYGTAANAGIIVQRSTNGQLEVPQTPTSDTHAASKKYVDDKFDTALTEAVVFRGVVANQTLLPTTGMLNGDLYWITEFVDPAPTGITVGDSGAAIWNAKLATPQWQYSEDAIYAPDESTITLNNNSQLSVKVSTTANNALTTDANGLYVNISGKLDKNTAITGATKCKITYDSKGLVTAGADLSASDIPSLTLSKISDVTATATEVNRLSGVTSNVQTQIDSRLLQFTEMPSDPSLYVGKVVQYIGTDDIDYNPNYFYRPFQMDEDVWIWENVNVQYTPSGNYVPSASSLTNGKPLVSAASYYGWNDTISYPLKLVNTTTSTLTQLTIGRGTSSTNYMYFKPTYSTAQMSIGFGTTDRYVLTTSLFRPNTNNGASLGNSSYKWSSIYATNIYTSSLSGVSGIYDSNYRYHDLTKSVYYFSYVPTEMENYDGAIMQWTSADTTYYDPISGENKEVKQGYFYKGTYDEMAGSTYWTQIDVQPSSGGTSLPSQTGNSGKFLTTDGVNPSWANVNLNSLGDVSTSSITNGQMLYWDDMGGTWYNGNAPKEVMFATIDTTTYATIKNWVDNGYFVVAKRNTDVYYLSTISDTRATFKHFGTAGVNYISDALSVTDYYVTSTSGSTWYGNVYYYQKITPHVGDFSVDSSTGAITCTFTALPTNKSVHTVIGNTAIAGTWSGSGLTQVFTPTTASDILDNANGFVVTVS